MIKTVVGAFSSGALVLALLSSVAPRLSGSEASARSCYRLWAEAQKMGSHYRHLVYVENDCEYWLQCSVWTDADPQPPVMLSVGPGMTEKRETSGDSQYGDPKAFGACRRQ
ncbi:MAG: hypothetical protein WBN15_05715 [Polyangiales bacterium]|jgi:hypothetical protein